MAGGTTSRSRYRRRWMLAALPLCLSLNAVASAAPYALSRGSEDEAMVTAPHYALVTDPPADEIRLNSSGQDVLLVVPVREIGPLGQAEVRITPDDRVFVSAADIARALSRGASEATVAAVQATAGADGFVEIEALRNAGVNLTFDRAAIEIVVALDAEARLRRSIPLGFETLSDPPLADTSEPVAIALSYQASLDYEHVGPDEGWQSPRVNLDLNGRIKPFAFENQFTYDGDLDDPFRRQASRLIFDQPFQSLRWTGGDQVPTPTSFQNAVDVAGLGLSRLAQTYESGRSLAATTSRSLTLRAPAVVEIYVNGLPVRTVELPAGVYDLTDLPLTSGANSVQIVVQDEAGDRQIINFDFFSDFELLAPGLSEFDFQAGVRAPFINGEREYEDEPVATGFYRRGLTEQLTGGFNFQIAELAQQVGIEALWGTPAGLFSFDVAGSNIDGLGGGYAARAQYRYTQDMFELRGVRRFDVSVEHRSRDFGSIEDIIPINRFSWIVSARYAQPIRDDMTITAGADYSRSRDNFSEDRYGGSVGLNWRYDNRTSINGRISYISETFGDRDEFSLGVTAVRRFGVAGSVNASLETRDERYQIGVARAPIRPLNDIGYSAQLIHTRDNVGLDGVLTYFGNRGDIGLAHQTTFDPDGEILAQTTSTRVAGSMVLAGNRATFGRRVGNAFAIVKGHPTLQGADIQVGGRFTDDVIARSGPLGPALVPLGAYSRQTVIYDAPDAPTGYDLGEGAFELYPWLHAGFNLTVGSAYNVTAVGNLLDREGQPLILKSGVARSLTDPDAPPQQLFTNRTGRFGVSGLSAGRWRLSFVGGLAYDLDITPAQGALVQAGVLRPLEGETGQ